MMFDPNHLSVIVSFVHCRIPTEEQKKKNLLPVNCSMTVSQPPFAYIGDVELTVAT